MTLKVIHLQNKKKIKNDASRDKEEFWRHPFDKLCPFTKAGGQNLKIQVVMVKVAAFQYQCFQFILKS